MPVKYTTSGFPFIRGFPSHEWNDTRLLKMIGGQLYECEKFRFQKSACLIYNFGVPVFKGVPLPWMKWYTSFNDDWWPSVRGWKISLSQTVPCKNNRHFQGLVTFSKIVFQYKYWSKYSYKSFSGVGYALPWMIWYTSLTMIGGQLYEGEKIRFHKQCLVKIIDIFKD